MAFPAARMLMPRVLPYEHGKVLRVPILQRFGFAAHMSDQRFGEAGRPRPRCDIAAGKCNADEMSDRHDGQQ